MADQKRLVERLGYRADECRAQIDRALFRGGPAIVLHDFCRRRAADYAFANPPYALFNASLARKPDDAPPAS